MSTGQAQTQDLRIHSALDELRGLIRQRYPEATFDLAAAADNPGATHLWVTVDTDDLDEVADLVIERELEFQVEQGLPIHVIPIRPLKRVLAMRQAEATRRPRALGTSSVAVGPTTP